MRRSIPSYRVANLSGSGSRLRVAAAILVAAPIMTIGCAASAPESAISEPALSVIEPEMIRGHLRFLSHDLLRGRDTGDVGYEIAREYVASQMAGLGLEPMADGEYVQGFGLLEAHEDLGSEITVGDLSWAHPEALFAPDWLGERPVIEGPGLFAGYGIVTEERDDYGGRELAGRVVFLVAGLPSGMADDRELAPLSRLKHEIAYRRGAAAVVTLQPPPYDDAVHAGWQARADPRRPTRALADGTTPSPRPEVRLGPAASAELLERWGIVAAAVESRARDEADAMDVDPVAIRRRHRIEEGRSWNVGGVVRGRDPQRRDQVVVFTAHLDHVGVGDPDETGDRIYNGTHDNALGTAKLLASAAAMSRLEPARSVLFLAVGAEESGLLGSWHYVRDPAFPIDSTVAAINHDGGLEGPATDDVFVFGEELTDFGTTLDELAAQLGLSVTRERPAPFSPAQSLLFRSDHYTFMVAGVPAFYLMPGFTIDGDPEAGREMWRRYLQEVNHRQGDDYDPSWSLQSPVRMAKLSVVLARHLADDAGMPQMSDDAPVRQRRRSPADPWFLRDDAAQLTGPGPSAPADDNP